MDFGFKKFRSLFTRKTDHSAERVRAIAQELRDSIDRKKLLTVQETAVKLRELTENLLWVDQNGGQASDEFVQCRIMDTLIDCFHADVQNEAHVARALAMLVENIKTNDFMWLVLSNNRVSELLVDTLRNHPRSSKDLSALQRSVLQMKEETFAHFVAFAKSLVLRLDASSINLFFQADSFPIFEAVLTLFDHPNVMVQIAVRVIALTVFKIDSAPLKKFILNKIAPSFFRNLAARLDKEAAFLDEFANSPDTFPSQRLCNLADSIAEEVDFLNDVFCLNWDELSRILAKNLLEFGLLPMCAEAFCSKKKKCHISFHATALILGNIYGTIRYSPLLNQLTDILFHPQPMFHLSEILPAEDVSDKKKTVLFRDVLRRELSKKPSTAVAACTLLYNILTNPAIDHRLMSEAGFLHQNIPSGSFSTLFSKRRHDCDEAVKAAISSFASPMKSWRTRPVYELPEKDHNVFDSPVLKATPQKNVLLDSLLGDGEEVPPLALEAVTPTKEVAVTPSKDGQRSARRRMTTKDFATGKTYLTMIIEAIYDVFKQVADCSAVAFHAAALLLEHIVKKVFPLTVGQLEFFVALQTTVWAFLQEQYAGPLNEVFLEVFEEIVDASLPDMIRLGGDMSAFFPPPEDQAMQMKLQYRTARVDSDRIQQFTYALLALRKLQFVFADKKDNFIPLKKPEIPEVNMTEYYTITQETNYFVYYKTAPNGKMTSHLFVIIDNAVVLIDLPPTEAVGKKPSSFIPTIGTVDKVLPIQNMHFEEAGNASFKFVMHEQRFNLLAEFPSKLHMNEALYVLRSMRERARYYKMLQVFPVIGFKRDCFPNLRLASLASVQLTNQKNAAKYQKLLYKPLRSPPSVAKAEILAMPMAAVSSTSLDDLLAEVEGMEDVEIIRQEEEEEEEEEPVPEAEPAVIEEPEETKEEEAEAEIAQDPSPPAEEAVKEEELFDPLGVCSLSEMSK